MDKVTLLENKVKHLEDIINFLVFSDRYIFQKRVQFFDAKDISFGSNKGTRIGTSTSQKFAFHDATPVVQRSGSAQAIVSVASATQTTPWGYASQAQADGIITLLNELRAALIEKGLIKGSA